MKILIVNGYRPTPVNKNRFEGFVKLVKDSFKKHKAKCSSSIEYIIRDGTNIDDYLYISITDIENQK